MTLTNPTDTRVSLEPCPTYEEYVSTFQGEAGSATVLDYRLNCDAVAAIGPKASVTFEMRLAVPSDQVPGYAKFGWDVVGGRGPYAHADLTVVA